MKVQRSDVVLLNFSFSEVGCVKSSERTEQRRENLVRSEDFTHPTV